MALLSVKDVCVGFGGSLLLDHIELHVERHERVCLLGRNGSGKTTLMKLINGEISPDSGAVARGQGIVTARLDQEIPAAITGQVIDIVYSGLAAKGNLLTDYHHVSARLAENQGKDSRLLARLDRLGQLLDAGNGWEIHRQVDHIIARMSLPADAEFQSLSTGMKRRTLLARALVSGPDILMLDEPTNHLDIEAISWLEGFLSDYSGTILMVTHDRQLVEKLASRIIEIDRGQLLDWSCDYATFLQRKEENMAHEEIQKQLFDKKLSEEEAWLRQGIKARRTRSQSRLKTLLKMRAQRRQRQERPGSVTMTLQPGQRSGNLVIEAKNIHYRYPGKQVINDFSTTIMRGDRVGIIGANGCGKTTLLRLLLGELTPQQGHVRLGTNMETVYFDQRREQLNPEKTVFDNVADGNDRVLINGISQHVIGYLQKFLFTAERSRTRVKSLSGGERCRLLLARLFTRPANLLVLDEPTNDLDIETLEFLEELLLDFQGTLLLVSHDRAFLNNVVTSTLVFGQKGQVEETIGGYDDWLRQKATLPSPANEKTRKKPAAKARPASIKLTFNEERELEALPGKIKDLEEEIKQLYQKMADPAFYRGSEREVRTANSRLQSLENESAAAYVRWEFLEERKGQTVTGKK
ncbi:MAG: ATP-binding cassette domain-containing protein [Candidatus Aminicenantes bacterium]|nr:ATP-binding cassette domain-containing protein [Candidatus Aminicenantes bacterium]